MKNTNTCPKCQSGNIVRFDGFYGPYGAGNHVVTGVFSSVNVNRYICCNCGFSEEWIDEKDIAKVANSNMAKR